jgi:hypothetical protein
MKELARTHVIERTSQYGEDFIGICRLCGMSGLTMGDALKECLNQRGLTEDEALIESIEGTSLGTFAE